MNGKQPSKPAELVQMLLAKSADAHAEMLEAEENEEDYEDDLERQRRKYDDEASDVSSFSDLREETSSLSVARRRHIEELQAELQEDIDNGLLITKKQYDHLRYEDEKILALHSAKNICDLYKLAERIILGDRPPEEEEAVEEQLADPLEHLDPESTA